MRSTRKNFLRTIFAGIFAPFIPIKSEIRPLQRMAFDDQEIDVEIQGCPNCGAADHANCLRVPNTEGPDEYLERMYREGYTSVEIYHISDTDSKIQWHHIRWADCAKPMHPIKVPGLYFVRLINACGSSEAVERIAQERLNAYSEVSFGYTGGCIYGEKFLKTHEGESYDCHNLIVDMENFHLREILLFRAINEINGRNLDEEVKESF